MRFLFLLIFSTLCVYANDGVGMQRFFIEDQNSSMTAQTIVQNSKSLSWQPLTGQNDVFQGSSSRIWVKLLLNNPSNVPQERVVELPTFDRGNLIVYDKNGALLYSYGFDQPFGTMSFSYPRISIPFTLPSGVSTFYLSAVSSQHLDLNMELWESTKFKKHVAMSLIYYGGYFSGMILLIFYNIVFYIFNREKMFLYYVLYSSSIVLAMLFSTGFGYTALWPDKPWLNGYGGAAFYFPTLIFALIFSKEFLKTKQFVKRIDKLMTLTIYAAIAVFFLNNFVDAKVTMLFILLLSFSAFGLMIAAAAYVGIIFKEQGARLVTIGWGALIVGVSAGLLSYYGFIEEKMWTHKGSELGTFIEITLFSMALASRYRDQRLALIKSKAELTHINRNLENIVEQKTYDLRHTNKKLRHEAVLNDQLLKELTHRVKNNLQVILSFLSLQIKSSTNSQLNSLLEESRRRILAISAVHEHLISTHQFERIAMDVYFKELLEQNSKIFKDIHVKVQIDMHDISLPIQTATLIGLIVNEVFNNACKHAYNGVKEPVFSVWMQEDAPENYELKVGDNGSGLSEAEEDSLGMKIIIALIKQLKGSYEIVQDGGVVYNIHFMALEEKEENITQNVT